MTFQNIKIPLSEVYVDRTLNSRVDYGKGAAIERLGESIKKTGLIHPPTVVSIPKGMKVPADKKYILVAGFRRFDALDQIVKAKEADFRFDPEASIEDGIVINITENIGRKNVSRYEIAAGFWKMHTDFKMNAEKIASRIRGDADSNAAGDASQPMSESNIENYLRMFKDSCTVVKDAWAAQHPKASIRNLLDLIMVKDHVKQARAWYMLCGDKKKLAELDGKPESEVSTPDAKDKEGTGKGGSVSRPSRDKVLLMIEEIEGEAEDLPKGATLARMFVDGMFAGLRWAAGEDVPAPDEVFADFTRVDSERKAG